MSTTRIYRIIMALVTLAKEILAGLKEFKQNEVDKKVNETLQNEKKGK